MAETDLISRQAAIDALGERPMVWVESDYELGARNQYDADVLALETVPSAQPMRKKGRWIEDAETFYKTVNEKGGGVNEDTPYFTDDDIACSECLALFSVIDNCTERFEFCPNCGADMRGEEE